jgi:hypothetical protein
MNLDDHLIVSIFGSHYRGIVQYYGDAKPLSSATRATISSTNGNPPRHPRNNHWKAGCGESRTSGLGRRPVEKDPNHGHLATGLPVRVGEEGGLSLPDSTETRVWDSSAEPSYWVLPLRPPGTDGSDLAKPAELTTPSTTNHHAARREPTATSPGKV